jgi:protein-S-isoprenylcysteine O-methyltransferase Ste14
VIEYLVIILGVALFGLQHSGISAMKVKNKIIDKWGKKGYSRIFTLTSVVTLLVAFLAMNFQDWLYPLYAFETYNPLQLIAAITLVVMGLALTMRASSVISVSTVADMRTDRMPELITDGIYSKIRHPLYLATIILLTSLPLLYPFPEVAVFSISLIVYTMIGAYFEEKKLILHYGDEYLEYKKKAGFLLPRSRP